MRHGLLCVARQHDIRAEVDEWEKIIHGYATTYLTAPTTLISSYLVDVEQLSCALQGRSQHDAADLDRVGAYLTGMTAWAFGNSGDSEAGVRWWRTAHKMAAISADPSTQVWVAGQEVFMALYDPRNSLNGLLRDLQRFEPLLQRQSVASTASGIRLIAAKAQVLAMAGGTTEATEAMRLLYDAFNALPDTVTRDRSFFGWPETRLNYVQSYVYSHLGDYRRASEAQDLALTKNYPAGSARDYAKIELMRALCIAKGGGTGEAAIHAVTQLNSVAADHHDLVIGNLAGQVLRSFPGPSRSSEFTQLRDYVASRQTLAIEA